MRGPCMQRDEVFPLIEALCDIADQEGPEITETETRNQGETWQRTINPIAAIGAAGALLNAFQAGRDPAAADVARAQAIIKAAQWHKISGGE